jgi:hypothetical protein
MREAPHAGGHVVHEGRARFPDAPHRHARRARRLIGEAGRRRLPGGVAGPAAAPGARDRARQQPPHRGGEAPAAAARARAGRPPPRHLTGDRPSSWPTVAGHARRQEIPLPYAAAASTLQPLDHCHPSQPCCWVTGRACAPRQGRSEEHRGDTGCRGEGAGHRGSGDGCARAAAARLTIRPSRPRWPGEAPRARPLRPPPRPAPRLPPREVGAAARGPGGGPRAQAGPRLHERALTIGPRGRPARGRSDRVGSGR